MNNNFISQLAFIIENKISSKNYLFEFIWYAFNIINILNRKA
jgi:hypothetical protein